MAREIEVKILDINEVEVTKRLEILGAKKISDNIQRILTYDFRDISSEYHSIVYDLKCNISQKTVEHALSRAKQLFFDIDDLIKEKDIDGHDRGIIKKIFNTTSLEEYFTGITINDVNKELLDNLNNKEFIKVIEKYRINPNKWIRLRQTGDDTTITIKHILGRKTNENGVREHSINNVLEYEIAISDFNQGKTILELLGYYHKNYQEKRRITYKLNNREIDIDYWPHIPPYLEVEAESETEVYEILEKLGYNKKDAKIMNADDVYTYYGINMYAYKELKFEK